jgi:NAD(P)-dependent dehydrogenase (short-subunit alcohol dehydrogenase family)
MSSVLITGAATGIGNLTARALAADGHRVYATMRHPDGANAARATELRGFAERDGLHLQVVELDVLSELSVTAAVNSVLQQQGPLDVVVHNAGHLALGYSEAFTAPEIARLFDTNVLGMHRVNRAVLPYMRARRSGTLVYVGSTTTVDGIAGWRPGGWCRESAGRRPPWPRRWRLDAAPGRKGQR